MSKVLDTALTIIDRDIRLKHSEIVRKVYAETGYCDQDYNKYLAVISSGSFTLRDYIRKRKLFFAVGDLISNPEKPACRNRAGIRIFRSVGFYEGCHQRIWENSLRTAKREAGNPGQS